MRRKITLIVLCICCSCIQLYAQCGNEDFEDGTTNGWEGKTGSINDDGTITLDNNGLVNGRHTIMTGDVIDEVAESCNIDLRTVEPGGLFSLRLGNDGKGQQAEAISKTFTVEDGKQFFQYKYAVVLEDPDHDPEQQPRFEVRVYDDNGDIAPCGEFSVTAGENASENGFEECRSPFFPGSSFFDTYWVKNWTTAGVDLSDFIGETVTVEFVTADCAQGAHSGYAYVEASCRSIEIQVEDFCPGSTSVTVSITEGFQSYLWSNGDTGTSTVINNPQVGDEISVTVTSVTGCSSTFTKILEPTNSTVTLDPLADLSVCRGGSVSITATGENVGYFYWPDFDTRDNPLIISNITDNMTVRVQAFDANGCAAGQEEEVNIVVQDLQATVNKTDVSCSGASTGSAEVVVSTGTPPYRYAWSNGATTAAITDLAPGVYEVTVTDNDGNGCEGTFEVTITGPDGFLVVEGDSEQSLCERNNGRAFVNVSGGLGNYVYLWDFDGSTGNSLDNVPAGTYKVTVTDDFGNGCSQETEIEVTEPEVFLTFEKADPKCAIDDGSIVVTASGQFSNTFQYSWDNGATGATLTDIEAGTYVVTATDENGCEITQSITVNAGPDLLTAVADKTDPVCAENEGRAWVTPDGGFAPYRYTWSNGATTDTIYNVGAGPYTVTVMDRRNCEVDATITVEAPADLIGLQMDAIDATCGASNGQATATVTGGTPPYSYVWNNNETTATIDGLLSGTYEVTVTDDNDCETTETVEVETTINDISVSKSVVNAECTTPNGSAEITPTGGSSPYTVIWEHTADNTPELDNLNEGTYRFRVVDADGCETTDSVAVGNDTYDLDLLVISKKVNYGLSDGAITVEPQLGMPPFTFVWSPIDNDDESAEGLPAGTYQVTVTDDLGCVAGTEIILEEKPPIFIPNAFTPNADGDNDEFTIQNIEEYPGATVHIYNRWGNIVYKTKNYDSAPWNGSTSNGKIFPADTYYYVVRLNTGVGKPFVGYVDLIK